MTVATETRSNPSVAAPLNLAEIWSAGDGVFAAALQAGAGFSFTYSGTPEGPVFSDTWSVTNESHEANTGITRTVLSHDSGLVVIREIRVHARHDAIEYKLYFRNKGSMTLASICSVQSLDICLAQIAADGVCVIAGGGGMADGFLPPRTFAIRQHYFAPTLSDTGMADGLELGTEGGRSSNKDMPFFFVQNEKDQEGMFVAIGWSGQWAATLLRNPDDGSLRITGRIPGIDIGLEPGEEIEGPTILIGLYKGLATQGTNALRRLVRDEYTPRLAGEPFLPVATYDHIWNVGVGFDEQSLKALADGAAKIDQEYFLLDAGWYAGTVDRYGFSPGVGNWYDIDRQKLPNGLMPIADHVRSLGMQFGLWFEPERVAPGTKLAIDHPDWILWDHTPEPENSFNANLNAGYGLLNLGREDVQVWVREMLHHYVDTYGIKYIRYDMNIDPLCYWDANDKPGRKGITQLRYIKGFYAIMDWLREAHPDTVLEGCASGGRRIDLETVRRFHTQWISDYTVDPSIVRFHLFGINLFLPGNNHYVQYVLPTPNQKNFEADDLGFMSMFGGAFGTGGNVDLWSEELRCKAVGHVEIWKRLRRYLVQDYYMLSEQPANMHSWSGWQFHDPAEQSGFIQAFRTNAPEKDHVFSVHGLDDGALYRFEDPYSGKAFEERGDVARAELRIAIPPMSSSILTYAKVA